ncbi:hypothetical protein [Kitasatospora sp. NPDC059817]|uniref:hypothetical protein n=1 Tax=Kitasatospora sp. NPDC059817 TaxID=3346961 RepID=UPI003667BF90
MSRQTDLRRARVGEPHPVALLGHHQVRGGVGQDVPQQRVRRARLQRHVRGARLQYRE